MSATTLAGYDGIDWAKDTFEEMAQEPSHGVTISDIEARETREHVETEAPAPIVLEVNGEEIPAEPVGFGRRLRIGKTLMQAEQLDSEGRADAIDEMEILEALIDAIDMLNDATPAEYDRAFWDDLSQDDIMQAFRSFGTQSQGGGQGNA